MTIAPVVERSGVHFAALGLAQMLNGGAAIRSCSLAPARALTNGSAAQWLGLRPKLPGSRSGSGSNGASAKSRQNGSSEVAALVSSQGSLTLTVQCSSAFMLLMFHLCKTACCAALDVQLDLCLYS